MEENFQEEGISLLDILRLLLSKIKLLILVVLIGGLLGGGYAFWKSHNVHYYGTSVTFYVNPEKPEDETGISGSQYGVYGAYGRHVMDNMVRLLGSESFGEQLVLNGELLPAKKEGNDKLNLLIGAAKEKIDAANAATEAYEAKFALVEEEWASLYAADLVKSETFNKTEYNAVKSKTSYADLVSLYEGENGATVAAAAAKAAQNEADAARETALVEWRKQSAYKSDLSRIMSATKYSYIEGSTDSDDANNLARSFIYVNISVLNDETFAKELLERVKKVVPEYIEANMAIPDGYEGTNCQRTTRSDDIRLTNAGYTKNQVIKYAMLLAAAAFVVTCVIVIITDRSDKRLRDQDILTRKFNVPVLGVVPSIEELNEDPNSKKKNDRSVTEAK